MTQKDNKQIQKLYLAITVTACVLGFLLGYIASSRTGVEPGFFEQAETGGYGVVAEKSTTQDIDAELRQHYEQLSEEQ